jgi:hypothetical protein
MDEMESARPAAPFHDWPVDVFVPGAGFVWYRRDIGAFISQSIHHTATIATADLVNDYLDHLLLNEQRAILRMGGIVVLYDWRTLLHVDHDAPQRFMQRVQKRAPGYLRKSIVVFSPTVSSLFETALRAGSAFAGLALGRRIQLHSNIEAAVADAGVLRVPEPKDLRSLRPMIRHSEPPASR